MPMTDVKLDLELINRETGEVATTDQFLMTPESLQGFEGDLSFESGWSLDGESKGIATILFIPKQEAAPDHPVRYSFGGTLSYTDPTNGLTVTRELFPVTLTVRPTPLLDLTYFMQRDCLGDDPDTEDVVEPVQETEFALLIQNVGHGDAENVFMTTEQPEIVDNQKGLLVNFEIVRSLLNGREDALAMGGDVTTDFGTIPAGSTAYAQWMFECSLLGHFIDYKVEATHVSSYGDKSLSLLGKVTIHEMIRSIRIPEENDKAIEDLLTGWLCNDVTDSHEAPDHIYLSNGAEAAVHAMGRATVSPAEDEENRQYLLTLTPTVEGWNYGNVEDPTDGYQQLESIVRLNDGLVIPVRNFWQTDRTLRDSMAPYYENLLHFADYFDGNEPQEYLLTFSPAPSSWLEVVAFSQLDAEVLYQPLRTATVTFNKEIDPASFTTDDVHLECQGQQLDITDLGISSTNDEFSYLLNLEPLTQRSGYFVLTVQAAGITDLEGFNGRTGRQLCWTQYISDSLDEINADATGTLIFDASGQRVKHIEQSGLYIIVESHVGKKTSRKVYIEKSNLPNVR